MEESEFIHPPLVPFDKIAFDRPFHLIGQTGPCSNFIQLSRTARHLRVHTHTEITRHIVKHRKLHHSSFGLPVHQPMLIEREIGILHRPIDVVYRLVDILPVIEHPLGRVSSVGPNIGDAHHGQSMPIGFGISEVLIIIAETLPCITGRPSGYDGQLFGINKRLVGNNAPMARNTMTQQGQSMLRIVHQPPVQKIDRPLRLFQQTDIRQNAQRPISRIHRPVIATRFGDPRPETVVPPRRSSGRRFIDHSVVAHLCPNILEIFIIYPGQDVSIIVSGKSNPGQLEIRRVTPRLDPLKVRFKSIEPVTQPIERRPRHFVAAAIYRMRIEKGVVRLYRDGSTRKLILWSRPAYDIASQKLRLPPFVGIVHQTNLPDRLLLYFDSQHRVFVALEPSIQMQRFAQAFSHLGLCLRRFERRTAIHPMRPEPKCISEHQGYNITTAILIDNLDRSSFISDIQILRLHDAAPRRRSGIDRIVSSDEIDIFTRNTCSVCTEGHFKPAVIRRPGDCRRSQYSRQKEEHSPAPSY